MAQTTTISTKELQRLAVEAYEGKTLKVMLCSVGSSGFTAESTVANWQTVEQSGSGYVRFSATIATGSYDTGTGRYILPTINASFTATSAYSYDRVILFIDGETNIHSEIQESPNIALSAGQTQTYQLSLITDD
jgi:hypothetical protein|tara:strand:+ start:716 stop:1117 length:402 start_codon:yes stop_codon:yes gene_type:complete